MAEHRKFKRRHLIYYLQVREQETDEFLGYLIDISYEGMLLMSQSPLEVGKLYKLKIMLPDDGGEKKTLVFEGESKWCNNEYNPDFYDTGFRLQNVAMEDFKDIYSVIDKLGFKD